MGDKFICSELYHHGILGQKWGERNGPPYPLKGGMYSRAEKRKIYNIRSRKKNSIYNKKHFDEVLSAKKTTLSTLSYNKDRTKGADMFYATHDRFDKHQYNALFNKQIEIEQYDENGNSIGTGFSFKYKIDNRISHDVKVASEDSGARMFRDLYENDRDFYNFVTDADRMSKYFVDDKYKFKGYRESRTVLEKIRQNRRYVPTEDEVSALYRMFNYVIPYDGGGTDERGRLDMAKQRAKYFKIAKENGYGALLDTNDAIYGGFKARSPVIIFDAESVIPSSIKMTTQSSKYFSTMMLAGRKAMGV